MDVYRGKSLFWKEVQLRERSGAVNPQMFGDGEAYSTLFAAWSS